MNSDEILIAFQAYAIAIADNYEPDESITDNKNYAIDIAVKLGNYMESLDNKEKELLEQHDYPTTKAFLNDILHKMKQRIYDDFESKYLSKRSK